MKLKHVILAAIVLLVDVRCTKDGFSVEPQLTFNSVNTTRVENLQLLTFSLDYTDKDGDVQGNGTDQNPQDTTGGALYYYKYAINCNHVDSGTYSMPADLPETKFSKGTVNISFFYGTQAVPGTVLIGRACTNIDDTCIFKFVLKDKAGHRSDTATSTQIVLVKS